VNFEERAEMRLNDHAGRIRTLEIKEAAHSERIDSLCKRLDDVIETIENWMKFAQNLFWKVLGAAGGLITILALFFIWYVQSLPR